MRNAPSDGLTFIRCVGLPTLRALAPPEIGTIAFLSRETAASLWVTGDAHTNVSTSRGGGKSWTSLG